MTRKCRQLLRDHLAAGVVRDRQQACEQRAVVERGRGLDVAVFRDDGRRPRPAVPGRHGAQHVRRDVRHVREDHDDGVHRVRDEGDARADRGADAARVIGVLHDLAGQALECRAHARRLVAEHDHHAVEVGREAAPHRAPDERLALERRAGACSSPSAATSRPPARSRPRAGAPPSSEASVSGTAGTARTIGARRGRRIGFSSVSMVKPLAGSREPPRRRAPRGPRSADARRAGLALQGHDTRSI